MKNLVVCCDGTWKRADDRNVSNIEKMARAMAAETADGITQIVFWVSGVGTGASRAERILGGALGIGMDSAIVDAYRFLAINYRPGDSLFVFGFSRGAYTARSLIGMISAIGLLTPDGVAANRLPDAITLYRSRPRPEDRDDLPALSGFAAALADFESQCHPKDEVAVRFLGVFDTVGSLGVPGFSRRKYKFHDVQLSPIVATARQALAIAERRRLFAPSLWSGQDVPEARPIDIKQVWFDGVHSDIGGGYAECALADDTLSWMVTEATACGLAFVPERLLPNLQPDPVRAHDSLTFTYRMVNFLHRQGRRVRSRFTRRDPGAQAQFGHGWRTLAPAVTGTSRAFDIRVARSVYDRRSDPPKGWPVNPNLDAWFAEVSSYGGDPLTLLFDVPRIEHAQPERNATYQA